MVKIYLRLFIVTLFFVSFSSQVYAATFTASVDRSTVSRGESIMLRLSLEGASPKKAPDLSVLSKDFEVYSTGTSQQTTIINGRMSSSVDWNVTLIPMKEGRFTIPSISMQSGDGMVNTSPIQVTVSQSAPTANAVTGQAAADVFVKADISKTSPYQGEPVILTVKMVARKSIANIDVEKPEIQNAIIEQLGDATLSDVVMNGERVKKIVVQYRVTPLSDGAVTIPPMVFKGQIASGQSHDRLFRGLRGGGSMDPFDMLATFSAFDSFKPFAVASDDIVLQVKAPVDGVSPWLPAKLVRLTDQWQGVETAKVGEPITRNIVMQAAGLAGSQLPSLEGAIDNQSDFKVYSDKPQTGDVAGTSPSDMQGWRKESYTLVPRKAGQYTLPEIKLAWWNVDADKIEYATLPEKIIMVAENENASLQSVQDTPVVPLQKVSVQQDDAASLLSAGTGHHANILYAVIAGLCFVVVLMTGILVYLFYKKPIAVTQKDESHVRKAIGIVDISNAETGKDLRNLLQLYAQQNFALPKNASLRNIAAKMNALYPQSDVSVIQRLDESLYSKNGNSDFADVKAGIVHLLKQAKGARKTHPSAKHSRDLNPS